MGGTAAFVDAEHALDPIYARKLGVDVENLLISQPDTGEQSLEIADTLVDLVPLIFWSSTRLQLWCQRQNWKAIWAIVSLVFRPV